MYFADVKCCVLITFAILFVTIAFKAKFNSLELLVERFLVLEQKTAAIAAEKMM